MIECPNCRTEYFIEPQQNQLQDDDLIEDEEDIVDEFEERNR